MSQKPDVRIFKSAEELFERAAQFILSLIDSPPDSSFILHHSSFTMVLAGGSTPRGLYERMASPEFRDRFPWERIHFFWGDERWVPPTDPRSNFKMAKEALLAPAGVPEKNIHSIPTLLPTPDASAAAYEKELREFFLSPKEGTLRKAFMAAPKGTGSDSLPVPFGQPSGDKGSVPVRGQTPFFPLPTFDLVLLGLGEDGHTASLFPGDPALEERIRWVVPARTGTPEPRITLTLSVLNAARHVLFLVSGKSKRPVIKQLFKKGPGVPPLPAGRIHPGAEKLTWFLDAESA